MAVRFMDEEQERQAQRIAYGLFVLESPLWWEHEQRWQQVDPQRRDLFMARARFVLSTAENAPTKP